MPRFKNFLIIFEPIKFCPVLFFFSYLHPFQNGIISEKLIENKLGKNRVFGAVAQISCFKNNKNEIIHNGKLATFFVGSMSKKNVLVNKVEKFVQKQNLLGLDIRYTQNIEEKIWDKFIFFVCIQWFNNFIL